MVSPRQRSSSPSQRRGAKVVAAILEATLEELTRVGLGGLSFDAVAQRAKVNKTTLYRRWPTKSRLVLAALATQLESLFAAPDTGDVHEDLVILARRINAFIRSRRGRALYLAILQEADISIVELKSALPHDDQGVLHQIVRRSVARGELPEHSDSRLLASVLFGAVLQQALFDEKRPNDAYFRRLVGFIVTGASVAARGGRTATSKRTRPSDRERASRRPRGALASSRPAASTSSSG